MRSRLFKGAALCMMLVLMLGALSACSKKGQSASTIAETEYKTVIDQNGRTVKVPTKINRVVVTSMVPVPSAFFVATGSCEKLVGVHPAAKSAAEVSILGVLAPEIFKAETTFIKGSDLNIEELIKLKPDVVFFRGPNGEELKQLEAAGIPAVAIKPMARADGNTLEIYNSWIKLIGEVMGQETRADEIINLGREAEKMVADRVKNVSEDQKPQAMVLYKHDDKKIEIAGSNFFGSYWLKTTGARDAAQEINGTKQVNMEQIYKWNPDIIYITNFTSTLPEDLLNNTITGQDWSKVKAVQNGKVYKIPLGIYRWFPPSGDSPLMLKWMAQKNQPELFKDYDITVEIKKYYAQVYKYNLSDQQVQTILNPPREGAKDAQ